MSKLTQANGNGKTTLDDVDRKIVDAVLENARISNAKLSRHVGLSESATLERVRRLERSGIILGYSAHIAPATLGHNVMALVNIHLTDYDERRVEDFTEQMLAIDEVVSCYQVLGQCDFVAHIAAESVEALESFFTGKLAAFPSVKHTESMFVLKCVKPSRI